LNYIRYFHLDIITVIYQHSFVRFRNVKLSNAKIESGAVTASSLTIPGQRGLAVFANGSLVASSRVLLDSNGDLVLRDLYYDVDMHSH
jgi:hypothetical protein